MGEVGLAIEFQMSLLLFMALAGYIISAWISQSAVVGQIIAGVIIGPSVLGLITYTDFIAHLGYLGAVVLLFVIGLDFKLNDITKFKYVVIAFFGVVIPWLSGLGLAYAFGFDCQTSIFIGTALTATSIAITANVLHELKKLHTKTAKAIIGAAVMDDILALLALTMTVSTIEGSLEISAILILIAKAFTFLIVATLAGYFIFAKLIHRVDRADIAKKYPEIVFIIAMMVAFFYALVAEYIGLSAIVGAFIAGVTLEGVKLRNSHPFKEGSEFLRIIFASIFFISLGILADFKSLDFDSYIFLILLTIVALLSKMFGCGLPAKCMGNTWRESTKIGIGMAPRGEVAMIIALIGLHEKLITQEVYVILVLMSLLTTLVTPILLRRLYPEKNHD